MYNLIKLIRKYILKRYLTCVYKQTCSFDNSEGFISDLDVHCSPNIHLGHCHRMHISIAISSCLLLLQYKIQTVQCHMSEVPTDLQDDQVVGKTARGFVSSNPQLGEGNKTREPPRLRVDGSNLIDPASGQPVTLHGVNWWSGYFQSDDGLDLETELPSANLVRLVGILWDNGNPDTDCRTDDASNGFLSDKCVRHLDNAIKACQRHNVWVVITCRAAEAAGDGYPEDVFHDPDLVVQFETMWRWAMRTEGNQLLPTFEQCKL